MNVSGFYQKTSNLPARYLMIDSDKKLSGTNVNWTTNNVYTSSKYLRLRNIQFIKNVYNINDYSFVIKVDAVSYNLPKGNYSITTLITALNALGSPLTFSHSTTTNKITATSGSTYILDFTVGNETLGEMLGFTGRTGGLVSIGASTTAQFQVNLNYSKYCDLVSDTITRNSGSSYGDASANIVCRIPLENYGYGSAIFEEYKTPIELAQCENPLGNIDFRLIDDQGRELQLDPNIGVSIVFDIII